MKTKLLISLLALGVSAGVGAATVTGGGTVTALPNTLTIASSTAVPFDTTANTGGTNADCLVQANDGTTRKVSAQWTAFTGTDSTEWSVNADAQLSVGTDQGGQNLGTLNSAAQDLITDIGNVNETGSCQVMFGPATGTVPTAGAVSFGVDFVLGA